MAEDATGCAMKWRYVDENRVGDHIGDHICYYSDLRKMRTHYPNLGRFQANQEHFPRDRERLGGTAVTQARMRTLATGNYRGTVPTSRRKLLMSGSGTLIGCEPQWSVSTPFRLESVAHNFHRDSSRNAFPAQGAGPASTRFSHHASPSRDHC